MRSIKSERLKKLEAELQDLEQWLKLGLVPKKDITKHKEEISIIREKIEEEQERLRFLKESGELEEYQAPKRGGGRAAYSEMHTLPDVDIAETGGFSEIGIEGSTDTEAHISEEEEEETTEGAEEEAEEADEDTYFGERHRWSRGGILDPDADEW